MSAQSKSRSWKNGLWYSYNDYLTALFGERVYRVTVSAGMTCPVRDGSKGTQGCTFCDERGSSSYFSAERAREAGGLAEAQSIADSAAQSIREQMQKAMPFVRRRFHANKFLAYFQSFTNTYAELPYLRTVYDSVIGVPDVVGMSVGTRPDCVPDDVLRLLASYAEKHYVGVELGLQSLRDETLQFYQRRHTAQEGEDAIGRIRAYPKLDLTVHLMFGAPGETVQTAIEAARQLNAWRVGGVKIHQLMILKGTILERYYALKPWHLPDLDEYNELVRAFIEHLEPRIHVERTHALATHPGELVAPEWSRLRFEPINRLKKLMTASGSYHGKAC